MKIPRKLKKHLKTKVLNGHGNRDLTSKTKDIRLLRFLRWLQSGIMLEYTHDGLIGMVRIKKSTN